MRFICTFKSDKEFEYELYCAAKNNHNFVKLLLKAEANLDYAYRNNITPLYIAAQKGCFSCVKLLLEAGADIHKADMFGASPLFVATRHGHTKIVKLLLDKGADIEQNDYAFFINPLCIAATLLHEECVELILTKIALDVLIVAHGKNMIFDTAFIIFKKCVQLNLKFNDCTYCKEYDINNPKIHSKLYKIFNKVQIKKHKINSI